MTGRWLVFMIVSLSLLGVGLIEGLVQRAVYTDDTGIVWVVVALVLMGAVSARWFPSFNDWLCEHGITLMVGLLGTVVGFMTAITGAVDGDHAVKMSGVDTALSTTAVGLVGQLYLLTIQRLMK